MKLFYSRIAWPLAIVLTGCVVEPTPMPTDDLQEIVSQSLSVYADLFADVLEEEANYVEAHPDTKAQQSQQRIRNATKEARMAAFQPFDEAVQKKIGGEKWNTTVAAKAYREIARNVRAAK